MHHHVRVRDRVVPQHSDVPNRPLVPQGTLVPDAVPQAARPQPTPLIRILIPVVMIVALGGMVGLMMLSGGGFSPMMLMFPLMMGVSMIAMFVPQAQADQGEARRVYLRQLGSLTRQAVENADAQREHTFYVHPHPENLWSLVGTPRMWGRVDGDPEAMTVRFGLGVTRLCTPITVNNPGAPEDMDPVCAVALRHAVRAAGYVRDIPVDASLLDFAHIHIRGRNARGLARAIIAQLVFHHGPEVLGITAPGVAEPAEDEHAGGPTAHVAGSERARQEKADRRVPDDVAAELELLAEYFDSVDLEELGLPAPAAAPAAQPQVPAPLTPPRGASASAGTAPGGVRDVESQRAEAEKQWGWIGWLPHSTDPEQADLQLQVVDTAFPDVPTRLLWGSTRTITVDVSGTATPPEDAVLVESDEQLRISAFGQEETVGIPDELSLTGARLLARRMSGYRRGGTLEHSTSDGFATMLGLPPIHTLTHEQLWGPRPDRMRLNVPFGTGLDGQPLLLDVKESAHGGVGPHGLCIGATGSGKSELLRTLVAALAATHSPEDVNMVLVDFKGGATFLGLDGLPHTSAVITNLEAEKTLVERMHDAISGEMNRRQELLRHAGNLANIGEYNARAKAAQTPPLPALLIIVDEFSELLGQHGEFAELFAAVGRLGRSLGIHLLLASQRVDEGRLRGLDSHLSYRIGLKTFSASESRQVLGVTDAYHLPATPGAGFIKTDADQVQRFQAAYVSGPLMLPENAHIAATTVGGEDADTGAEEQHATATPDTDSTEEDADTAAGGDVASTDEEFAVPAVRLFRSLAQRNATAARGPELVAADTSIIDTIVTLAQQAGEARGMKAHDVWLPPLPAAISLPELYRTAGWDDFLHFGDNSACCTRTDLRVPLGIIDKPFEQRQDAFILDLGVDGGHVAICGGPQSGKTTAMASLLIGLAVTHSTDDVAVYILDLGNGLGDFARLPHVAGIATRDDPERVRRIIDEVLTWVAEPRTRHTILIIDGWHTIISDYEDVVDNVTTIAADGAAVGVHLVMTTQRWTVLRPSIRDLIGTRMELKLAENGEGLLDRDAQHKVPARAPGRAITPDGEQMLFAQATSQDCMFAQMAASHAHLDPVPPLKTLPAAVSMAQLDPAPAPPEVDTAGLSEDAARIQRRLNRFAFPIGVGGPRLTTQVWDAAASGHLVIVGSPRSGRSTLLRTVATGIAALPREDVRLVIIDPRRSHLDEFPDTMVAAYCGTTTAATTTISDLVATCRERLPGQDITPKQLKERSWWTGPDLFVLIDDADILVEGTLNPLVEFLPHARDIGLHIVYVRKMGGIGRALFGGFLAELKDQQPAALVLDGDRDEGTVFGVRPSTQPVGRGTLTVRGISQGLMQVATP
ncbi:type VII secretion protein EccC [Corynebacterium sp. 13CS0277]|uniref:type VII secretion protein EccCa n=1 Tax=Corynebacterium sp. 13CS0277 TaxID=2071994 RepID=UPI000D0311E4|nr:type VII secretion protein EccCa [Corynebacterium sp. 13CS0277]PRQ11584.1 type VII secretion protein EccC [Corynebacterium sp. 13CS0277]